MFALNKISIDYFTSIMSNFWKYFTLFCLLILYLTTVKSQNVTIYTNSNGEGNFKVVNIGECVSPLDLEFDRAISSVNSHGQCIHLYKEQGCQGSFILLAPGTPGHNDLGHYSGFNDQVRSIGACHPKCHSDYVQPPLGHNITAELFDHHQYQGGVSTVRLSHGSCSPIPQKMRSRLTSILLSSPACVELHTVWNCTGDSKRLPTGSPFLTNLGFWEFNDRAKSISFCGLNCGQRMENSIVLEENQTPPGPGFVTIFSEAEFNGPLKHIELGVDDGHCTEILGEWQGEAYSIKVYNNCINIYELPECSRSRKNIQIKMPIPDLSTLDFDNRIRSIDRCHSQGKKSFENDGSTQIGRSSLAGSTGHNNNTFVIILTVGGLLLFVTIAVVGSVYIRRLKRGQRRIEYILTEKEIEEFMNGTEGPFVPLEDRDNAIEYAYSLPYDKRYEIPRDLISMDTKKPLGCGQYAVVYPGSIQHPVTGEKQSVAVKTIRKNAGDEYLRALLKEIKTMSYVGDHPYTVKLLGCCTQDLQNELFVLTELCQNGSMDKFLQRHRQSFANLVFKGQILEHSECQKHLQNYANLDLSKTFHLNTFYLIEWSYQIADGMEFLASKKVIHGDLAARNILLDSTYQVRIGDFGLSKQLYEYTQYVKQHQAPLPWRWSSIEILTKLEFSTESDIWAYGMTLWEIFSLGDTPYPGSVWGPDFLNSLKNGLRPSKPNFATSDCYNLMLDCWREEPSNRITFPVLKEKLADLIQTMHHLKNLCQEFNLYMRRVIKMEAMYMDQRKPKKDL